MSISCLDLLLNLLNAISGPRFFTPWTFQQLAQGEIIVDSSFLQIGEDQLLAILTNSSLIRVFKLGDYSILDEIQTLPISQAHSLKGFSVGGRSCLAVARSSQALTSQQENEAKSAVYCWNNTVKQYEKLQDLATRGAFHVEFVSIGSARELLVFSCSKYQGRSNTSSYIYVWSPQQQCFFLYQYLRTVGAVRSSAMSTEDLTILSVDQVNEDAGSSTKLFAWNGTYFHHAHSVSRPGHAFAAGRFLFFISSGTIFRCDKDSKNFTFHSTIQNQRDSRDFYEYFTIDNEHFLAVSQFTGNGNASLAIYRLNGFDFVPYQDVSVPSSFSSIKVFRLRKNTLVLAIMGEEKIELLKWKHM